MAPVGVDPALPDDIRVDQLAEFCAMAVKMVEASPPEVDVDLILDELGLRPNGQPSTIAAYPRAGGVAYHWYYAAGVYLKRGQGRRIRRGVAGDDRATGRRIAG